MKIPFPHKHQYAMNLTNKSLEAISRINDWVEQNGGSVEHKTLEEIRTEVLPLLKKE